MKAANKIIYLLIFLPLAGCISGKISHKSQVTGSQKGMVTTTVAAKVDESKNYHQVVKEIDTVIRTVPVLDTAFIDAKSYDSQPISVIQKVLNGYAKATFYPETGRLRLLVNIPTDTFIVHEQVKTTDITNSKQSSIDSSRNSKRNNKANVKGSTSLSASIMQPNWLWLLIGAIPCLFIGFAIGKNKYKQ